MQRRTKESVPVFNKTELSMDRIVKDVLRITYVYVATVDGRDLSDIWWYGDVKHDVVMSSSILQG